MNELIKMALNKAGYKSKIQKRQKMENITYYDVYIEKQ